MDSWGWRLPFLTALPLGVIGLYLRLKLEDTPVFTELHHRQTVSRSPVRAVLTEHRGRAALFFGVVILLMVSNYVLLTYLPTYMSQVLGTSQSTALLILIGVMLVMIALAPFLGRLSDRVGRKPILAASAVCFALFSYPAALPAILVLYAGFALSYNVAVAVFGGTAPLIVTALIDVTGNPYMPAFYVIVAALVSLGPILAMPETARASLPARCSRPQDDGTTGAEPGLEMLNRYQGPLGGVFCFSSRDGAPVGGY